MLNRNIIFSFSLRPESAKIVDSLPNGRKSEMVSEAILWWNYYSIEDLHRNIRGLQEVITRQNQRILELEMSD